MNEMAERQAAFSFGGNWQRFLERCLNPDRERFAEESLIRFLGMSNLSNLSFLDVGCGSGIFSLAAYRLGARQVVSFDVDPVSVECCERLRQRVGAPQNWKVLRGSVLDLDFLGDLEPADIVYAWGSLHHTGAMWQAIRNASQRVKPGGLFYVSIYNHVDGGSDSFWRNMKILYNRSSPWLRWLLEFGYVLRYDAVPRLVRLQNPIRYIRNYGKDRGMSYWTDVRDWLGGYPYECASAHEVFRFCAHELNMGLTNLETTNTRGTNQFLFRKRG
jgi:2-polyprenyl-6-hydroxyphenyl methylase/3-demethylubiquinone-9 3-methyltransferase